MAAGEPSMQEAPFLVVKFLRLKKLIEVAKVILRKKINKNLSITNKTKCTFNKDSQNLIKSNKYK
jgi:hypothetical protein